MSNLVGNPEKGFVALIKHTIIFAGHTRPEKVHSESRPPTEVYGGEDTRGLAQSREEIDCSQGGRKEGFPPI